MRPMDAPGDRIVMSLKDIEQHHRPIDVPRRGCCDHLRAMRINQGSFTEGDPAMTTQIQTVLMTGKTHTAASRRQGAPRGDDRVDIQLSTPGKAGNEFGFTAVQLHPTAEQLFAGAWSACYTGALGLVAKTRKVALPIRHVGRHRGGPRQDRRCVLHSGPDRRAHAGGCARRGQWHRARGTRRVPIFEGGSWQYRRRNESGRDGCRRCLITAGDQLALSLAHVAAGQGSAVLLR